MGRKGFTLIELLGVIVILSIILLIAVPNISSVLSKSKKENYITDAKKFISLTEYELRKGNINKPSSIELLKISLSYLNTNDIKKDPDGNEYDQSNSYVIVVRKEGYLEYFVNLVVKKDTKYSGIKLVAESELSKDNRLSLVQKDMTIPSDANIKTITGVNGTIKSY